MSLFFAALAVATFTSLIAMVEVATRAFEDAGFERRKAIRGFALILSGLFFALAVGRYGARRFREETLNQEHSDIRIGRWWDFVIRAVVPFEAVVLTAWLLYQSWRDNRDGWLLPVSPENVASVGTVLFQVGVVLAVLLLYNRKLAASVSRTNSAALRPECRSGSLDSETGLRSRRLRARLLSDRFGFPSALPEREEDGTGDEIDQRRYRQPGVQLRQGFPIEVGWCVEDAVTEP